MDWLAAQATSGSALELCLRVLLAVLAGGLVGLERQWHHKNAGIRTHALLALGATSFGLISHVLHLSNPDINPTQIAAGVVTGTGFICGGVIMHRGGSIQGLNSAASLWTTAGVGLAIGGGFYRLAGTLILAVLVIQFPLAWLEDAWNQRSRAATSSTWRLLLRGNRVVVGELWARCASIASTSGEVQRVDLLPHGGQLTVRAELVVSEAVAMELVRAAHGPGDEIAEMKCARIDGR
jgi:uncharacterized membrane protein YhiD involved in acid resistance